MGVSARVVTAELPLMAAVKQRQLGAYYTPDSAADFMASWLVRHDEERVLEPSFGDGTFLRAVSANGRNRNFNALRMVGVEINEIAVGRTACDRLIASAELRCEDFLNVHPFPVNAVIGNPPYVRLRRLPSVQRSMALQSAERSMGRPMDPSGSLWMPFVLHAMQFLERGGRLAFVLPYDFTYVRYARPLWHALSRRFGSLELLRTRERLFPDLLQDVVILLADDYASSTTEVRYKAFERAGDLFHSRPVVDETVKVADVVNGERTFLNALLDGQLRDLLKSRIAALTVPARNLVTFNIGYVAGDKEFFHPTARQIRNFKLPSSALHKSISSARTIKGAGLRTSSLDSSVTDRLFLPAARELTDAEIQYTKLGEENGAAQRYKCRIRKPWFMVPGVRVPDVVVTVFSERPVLLLNDANYFASNSFLCGYRLGVTADAFATCWYTSLTLLQCELEVHALGGGVMILVPREAGCLRLPRDVSPDAAQLGRVDAFLRQGKALEAYTAGDREVLMRQVGLEQREVELIREGIRTLEHWRTSARP